MSKMFKYFDIANKGTVNFEQFYRAMEKLGINVEQQVLYNIFQAVDKDGSGDLDYKEFSTGFFQDELQMSGDAKDPYIVEKNRQAAVNQNARREAPE